MRLFILLLAFALPAAAQDSAPPAPKKKPAANRPAKKGSKAPQLAHTKPTPDQIRKFNQLEKKQEEQDSRKK